ncbi:MAG: flavodoxin [Candidatus Woesearchaeota archaeon]
MTVKNNQEIKENEYIKVKKSGIHNAGVFAKKDIPKETKIIEYVGERITKKESEKRADAILDESKKNKEKGAVYIFEINKKYDLDGNVPYNLARYINHSCMPNCESENIDGKIWISSIKDIKKGEELLYNYGYDIDSHEEHPCLCGADECIGYIAAENKWKKLKTQLKKKFKNKKVLVAYYSRTGNTKKVAEYLAKYKEFDIDEIKTDNRLGVKGYIKSAYESVTDKKPKINYKKNPKNYDLIIIGTPIWANTIASPIRTYIEKCKNKEVIAFSTLGGKNPGKSFEEFSKNITEFKGMTHIQTKNIKQNKYQNQVLQFFKNVEL